MRPFDFRLVHRVPQARGPLLLLAILGISSGIAGLATAFALARVVVAVVTGESAVAAIWVLLAVLAVRAALGAATEAAAARAATVTSAGLRAARLAEWGRLPLDRRQDAVAELHLAADGAADVEPYVSRYLPALATAAVVPPLALLALLFTDWLSALIVVLTLPLLPLFAALIGQHTREETQSRQHESVQLAGHFLDVVRGLPTLVSYQRAERQAAQIRAVGERLRVATVRTLRTAFLSSAALELMTTICVAIVAVAVGLRLAGGGMGLTMGLTAILLAPEAYLPIRRVGMQFHAAADGAHALEELLEPLPAPAREPDASGVGPRVSVHGLGYRHPGSQLEVLHDLDLEVGVGLTCITGPSGAGKSTLLELLAGERSPSAGEVRTPTTHWVTQRPFLAPATVEQNLALAHAGGAETGSPAVPAPAWARAAVADLDPVQVLGDEGHGLSAGQRARLALARAADSGAPVVLLDEPTAHLDPVAAEQVRHGLAELAQDRVVIVVTHDPALAESADTVLDLPARPARGHDRGQQHPTRRPQPATAADDADRQAIEEEVLPHELDTASEVESDVEPRRRSRLWWPSPGIPAAAALGGLASASSVALTATSGWLVVRASERPIILSLLLAVVMVRAFGVARPALHYAERVLAHDAALADLGRRRSRAYRALIPLTPARLGQRRRADLLTGFVHDLDDEVDAQVRVVVPLLGAAAAGGVATAVAAALLPVAGLIILAMLLGAALLAAVSYLAESAGHRRALSARAEVGAATHLLTTSGTGLRAIGGFRWGLAQLESAHQRAAAAAWPAVRGRALGTAGSLLLTGAATAALIAPVGEAVRSGTLSAPVAAMVMLIPIALGDVLGTVPEAISAAVRARAAAQRVDALVDQEPAVAEPDPSRIVPGPRAHPSLATAGVLARWDSARATPAIEIPDLALRPGAHVALTGPNGAGKSTLAALLARHLDPARGAVLADDTDVRTLGLDEVRSRIAIVDDEPHLFAADLRANLRLAAPESTDAQAEAALRAAGLGDWLAELPDGLDTELDPDGGTHQARPDSIQGSGDTDPTPLRRGVSGGERARIALARALLSERPVLLLDEPVAHLDRPTAAAVLADLHAARADRSVLLITHQRVGVDGCEVHVPWPQQHAHDDLRTDRKPA
ncbi:thiol reductant ABC exporter subunit CydC [Dermacoccaceae bacterium W4C1]